MQPIHDKLKPNILLISTDTQRCDTLNCMGNPHAVSPNIDRLAREGVLFQNAHTASPVCSPARCSLMTGVHTPIHGCIENGIKPRNDLQMFPDLLKEQGYTNIMVGKTHFGRIPESFDVVHQSTEKNSDVNDSYAKFISKHGYSRVSAHPNPVPEDLFMDAYIANTTIEEIDKVITYNNGPFFAFCSLVSPHSPYDPPGKWANLYNNIPLPEINVQPGEIHTHPEQLKMLLGLEEEGAGRYDPEEVDLIRRRYYGLASYCDAQVGKILDYLDRTGVRENTLIIFTSDHGQQFYDHGFDDKHNYYDSSWRVPLIMSMPGTLPIHEVREFAVWTDITATILGAAGVSSNVVQGFDLFSPLRNEEASPRKCAVGTLYKSAALATKYWKLEYYFEKDEARMYDRVNDPLERENLFEQEAYQDVKHELLRSLLTWRSDIMDVQHALNSTGGGGPVARRISSHTLAMKGTDAEQRLNEKAEHIDTWFNPATIAGRKFG